MHLPSAISLLALAASIEAKPLLGLNLGGTTTSTTSSAKTTSTTSSIASTITTTQGNVVNTLLCGLLGGCTTATTSAKSSTSSTSTTATPIITSVATSSTLKATSALTTSAPSTSTSVASTVTTTNGNIVDTLLCGILGGCTTATPTTVSAKTVTTTNAIGALITDILQPTVTLAGVTVGTAGVNGVACSVTFNELVNTAWGESVYIVGSIGALGNWDPALAIPLGTNLYSATNPMWSISVPLPAGTTFQYKYIIKEASGYVTWEADPNRSYTVPSTCAAATTANEYDTWQSATTTASSVASTGTPVAMNFNEVVTTGWGQAVYVVGSIPQLGNWRPTAGVPLSSDFYTTLSPLWSTNVSIPAGTNFQYKYVVINTDGSVSWEADPNHSLTVPTGVAFAVANDIWQAVNAATSVVNVATSVLGAQVTAATGIVGAATGIVGAATSALGAVASII